VLTHWKEREPIYAKRAARIVGELGFVPAYAGGVADVAPARAPEGPRRRITEPVQPDQVSQAEFDALVRDLHDEPPAATAAPVAAAAPAREAGPPKPKRDKPKKPRNRRHGRAR